MNTLIFIGLGLMCLSPFIYGFIRTHYRKYGLKKELRIAMGNLFLERSMERSIDLPLSRNEYSTVVNEGIKSLLGPGYKAGFLHVKKGKIYLTLIHLSGNVSDLLVFTKIIDDNHWLEVEVELLKSYFLGDRLGKLLKYELIFTS